MIDLIVGLGNPGDRYRDTRHNAGFWFVDALGRQERESLRPNAKLHGEVGEVTVMDQRLKLLKPDTFMNDSGKAVAAFVRFYKIDPKRMLVAHDELDLAPGVVRLKFGGGVAGHNGLRSIAADLGTRDFWRLRIGVGHPGQRSRVTSHLLKPCPAAEQAPILESVADALRALPAIIQDGPAKAQNQLHTSGAGR